MSISLPGSWNPADTALRARMAALARSAQTAGEQISAPARKAFLGKFGKQAQELVTARLAKGERIANVEGEVERVRATLLRIHMLDLADRSSKARAGGKTSKNDAPAKSSTSSKSPTSKKNRPALGSHGTADNPTPSQSRLSNTEHASTRRLTGVSPSPRR